MALCALNMWGYLAAYKMPHDDPGRLEARVHIDYPIAIDRVLGLGVTPTQRLQQTFASPGSINRFERVLAWCHWMWFAVPHVSVALRAVARSRTVPQRGRADVRRVRHRRGLLLVDPDRAALVGGRAQAHGGPRCCSRCAG